MAKTNDFDLCKQYVMNYIENDKKQLNHCQFELTKQEQQFQTCTIKELSFQQIEQRLKELVDRERKYLSKKNNDILIKFKNDISEKQLLKTINISSLLNNQPVNLYNFKSNIFCFSY
jgi:predicted transcriptional regulator